MAIKHGAVSDRTLELPEDERFKVNYGCSVNRIAVNLLLAKDIH